jgi:hypothetical protein
LERINRNPEPCKYKLLEAGEILYIPFGNNTEVKLLRLFIRIFHGTETTLYVITGFIITRHLRCGRLQRVVSALESLPIKTNFCVVSFTPTVAMKSGLLLHPPLFLISSLVCCCFPLRATIYQGNLMDSGT